MAARRKLAAPVTPPTDPTAIEVARMQAEIEVDVREVPTVTIESADDYAFADSLLTEHARKLDLLTSMLKASTGPAEESLRVTRSWFAPSIDGIKFCISTLKKAMADYLAADAANRAHAQESTIAALESGGVVVAPEAEPDGRATQTWYWAVARVVREMLTDEWLVPDEKRIAEVARAAGSSEQPPVIPGVVFERRVRIGAKR